MRAPAVTVMSVLSILSLPLALGACSRDRSATSDCDVVRKDPGNAVAALGGRYPGAPAKVAETIERCVAPAGAPCERLAKIVAAIPNFMSARAPAAGSPADMAEACEGMPPEMQRCMLPSYVLGHADECRQILGAIAQAAGSAAAAGSGSAASPCLELRIDLSPSEISLRREALRTLERPGGKTDTDALRAALGELAAHCIGRVAIASTGELTYQEATEVMDQAAAAGFRELGISVGEPSTAPPRAPGAGPTDRGDMASAPVILATKEAISVGGTEVAKLAAADVTAPVADALVRMRAADPKLARVAILQADARTPMRVINQLIAAARRAGFDDLLFATKTR